MPTEVNSLWRIILKGSSTLNELAGDSLRIKTLHDAIGVINRLTHVVCAAHIALCAIHERDEGSTAWRERT
jgi:hypothetical protein